MKGLRRTLAWLALACLPGMGSTAYAQSCQTHTGLTYATYVDGGGQTQPLQLELLVPTGAAPPRPVVIWIHGGGWSTGSRLPIPAGVSALCSQGYAVASVDYRLSGPGARWPLQLHDVKGAVRWLRANAATYGLDPDRFAAWGSSAGAQLAIMLGTAANVGPFTFGNVTVDLEGSVGGNPGQSSRVQAVVNWFGQTDFLQMRFFPTPTSDHDAANSPESRLLGGPIQDLPELAATANAMTFASADDPPFLVMHGALDELVPFHQSELLVSALRAHGVRVTFVPVPTAGHGGGGFTTPANHQTVYDFLAAVLAEPPATKVSVQALAPTAAETGAVGSFRVSRTGGTGAPLTVRWDLQGTATLGADYSAPFSATIPAGAASVTIPVVPANDPLVEGNETVVIALAHDPAYGVEAARAQAVVTIADNESAAGLPAVQVAATDAAADEDGDPGAFTVSLDTPAPAAGLTVRYTVSGTALQGVDAAPLAGALTIPAGETSAVLPVLPVDDAVLEGSEALVVTLEAGAGYVREAPASVSVRIADTDFDPAVPVVSIAATDFTASEPGNNTGTFTVTRTGSTAASLVAFIQPGGQAREGSDYLTLPNGVIFDAGVNRVTVTVTPAGDSLAEGAETVTLATDADPDYLPGPQSSAVILADDEITGTAGFYPVRPCRLVDTRGVAGPRGAPALTCDGAIRVFEVTGACGIPPEATAISANVVAVAPTTTGHLSLFQIGAAVQTSTVNFAAGQTRANNVVLPLSGTPGTLAALCGGAAPGQADLVIDVNGYFR
ncbi:MAG TPA: Calx-beta domain-containing protein [Thermoanaerobaculia bacterium]|nr:Calx-beta domain-containing protein [Thermoanaerobaculia bacterium]